MKRNFLSAVIRAMYLPNLFDDLFNWAYAPPATDDLSAQLDRWLERQRKSPVRLGLSFEDYAKSFNSSAARLRAPEASGFTTNSSKTVAVANTVFWNEDMTTCPRGVKVQLLGKGGVAIYSNYTGASFWVGWAPLPRRRHL